MKLRFTFFDGGTRVIIFSRFKFYFLGRDAVQEGGIEVFMKGAQVKKFSMERGAVKL